MSRAIAMSDAIMLTHQEPCSGLLSKSLQEALECALIDVEDFPIKDFTFKDTTPIFKDPALLHALIEDMALFASECEIDAIVGPESFGFLYGVPLAYAMGLPFILVRKEGKLPRQTYAIESSCEYADSVLEIHKDDLKEGMRVLIVDDFLATGGTMEASAKLVQRCGASVAGFCFLIESSFLDGGEKLRKIAPVHSIIKVYVDNSKSRE